MIPDVLGAVLAGGQSRRFGSDKAEALLAGKPLLAHALDSLRAVTQTVVLCGRRMDGVLSLPDRPAGGEGPLAGLNAALHHAAQHGYAGVLCLGCDMPYLPRPAARMLVGQRAAVAREQYLAGYWPSDLAPLLDRHLARLDEEPRNRSVRSWIAVASPRVVDLPGGPLPNVNTPDDLAAIARSWTD